VTGRRAGDPGSCAVKEAIVTLPVMQITIEVA
jgi:hypothetical protein